MHGEIKQGVADRHLCNKKTKRFDTSETKLLTKQKTYEISLSLSITISTATKKGRQNQSDGHNLITTM